MDILNALNDGKCTSRVTSDYRKELSEHIAREISMLTGGKARWTCLPRSILLLVISCMLFCAITLLVRWFEFDNTWAPAFVFFYFILLIAGVACLSSGLRNAYRYVSLRAYLLHVISSVRSASFALKKLNASLTKIAKSLHDLTDVFNEAALEIERFRPKIETVPPDYIFTDIDNSMANLKDFKILLIDKKEEIDAGVEAISALQDLPLRIMEDVRYIEERTVYSFALIKEKRNLEMQKDELQKMKKLLKDAHDNIDNCQRIVNESIELYGKIKASGVFNDQVVLKDENSGLVFVTSKDMYANQNLDTIFDRISSGEFRIFKTDKTCSTLVVGKENGPASCQVVGFLSAHNGRFPENLRIIESPLYHTRQA